MLSILRHTSVLLSYLALVSCQLRTYNGTGPVNGQTPCCLDRMTTVSCNRLQLLNPPLFLDSCVNNADFAFVQCCKSCFDLKQSFSLNLDYSKIAETLLTNSQTAACFDRRGEVFCEQLVRRKLFWIQKKYKTLDCASMPFAFRVCRKSCGYCSTTTQAAGAIYDYAAATDPTRCNNPAYGLALLPSEPRGIATVSSFRKLRNRYTFQPNKVTPSPQTEAPTTTEMTTTFTSKTLKSEFSTEGTILPPENEYSTEGTVPPPHAEITYAPVPEEITERSELSPQVQEIISPETLEMIMPLLPLPEQNPLATSENFKAWWAKSPIVLKKLFGPQFEMENDK